MGSFEIYAALRTNDCSAGQTGLMRMQLLLTQQLLAVAAAHILQCIIFEQSSLSN
jgi:hypothetical protein